MVSKRPLPAKGAEKSYKLLLKALDETKPVGIAEFMLRNRAHICILKNYDGVLLLNQLRYHEEVKDVPEVKTATERITPKEIQFKTNNHRPKTTVNYLCPFLFIVQAFLQHLHKIFYSSWSFSWLRNTNVLACSFGLDDFL